MARIDPQRRLVELKLVYYGPALGGKTTNLQALHAILDPEGEARLMSLDTEGDRTLFFDLLPIQLRLGRLLNLKLRLFTVPGQVHYNATRRLVLQQADGVVFVADSSPERLVASRDSLSSLDDNLVANGVLPGQVPIVVQANKRDLPGALAPARMWEALAPEELRHHGAAVRPGLLEASAIGGEGVLETFEALLRATLAAVHRRSRLGASGLGVKELSAAVDELLGPFRESGRGPGRARERCLAGERRPPEIAAPRSSSEAERVLPAPALLEESLKRSMDLAEALGDQHALSHQLADRVAELESLQRLGGALAGAETPREVARAAVEAAAGALPGGAALLLRDSPSEGMDVLELAGRADDPLTSGSPCLASLLRDLGRPVHYADLDRDLLYGDRALLERFAPACTLASVPLRLPGDRRGLLVALGNDPDRPAGPNSLRFLQTIAAQVTLSLEVVQRRAELGAHRDRLEVEVGERTVELRQAHDQLVAASRLKDRILSTLNHELRTPVTRLLSAGQAIERARPGTALPPRLLSGLVQNARELAGLLDQVLSAQSLLAPPANGADGASAECDLGATLEAVVFTHRERAVERQVTIESGPVPPGCGLRADPGELTLLLSQLLDNAIKFTARGSTVRVRTSLSGGELVELRVSDEGPGIPALDAARIFDEFDQGGADLLVAKPDGLGLGLAIARRLARRMGGELEVDREARGRGATLVARLPALPRVAAVGEPSRA